MLFDVHLDLGGGKNLPEKFINYSIIHQDIFGSLVGDGPFHGTFLTAPGRISKMNMIFTLKRLWAIVS